MINLEIDNYWDILETPRIDDKKIVYTFKLWNKSWGKVDFLDLKNGNAYEGRFALVEDTVDKSEINIHFVIDGDFGFFDTADKLDIGSRELTLSLDAFLTKLTKPYII